MRTFIKHFSGFTFFLLGLSIFVSLFLIKFQFHPPFPQLYLQSIDIPFVLFSLLYGGTSLRDSFEEDHNPVIDGAIFIVCIALFSLFVFVNLAYPDILKF